jgi:hypothetical protein
VLLLAKNGEKAPAEPHNEVKSQANLIVVVKFGSL